MPRPPSSSELGTPMDTRAGDSTDSYHEESDGALTPSPETDDDDAGWRQGQNPRVSGGIADPKAKGTQNGNNGGAGRRIKQEEEDEPEVIEIDPPSKKRKLGRPAVFHYRSESPQLSELDFRRTTRSSKVDTPVNDAPEVSDNGEYHDANTPKRGRGRPRGRPRGSGRGGRRISAAMESYEKGRPFVAKPWDESYSMLQHGVCFSKLKHPKPLSHTAFNEPHISQDHAKCVACRVRQSKTGTCRFKFIRHFKDLSGLNLTATEAKWRHDKIWTLKGDQPANYIPLSKKLPSIARKKELMEIEPRLTTIEKLAISALPKVAEGLSEALCLDADHEYHHTDQKEFQYCEGVHLPIVRMLPHGDARVMCDDCQTTIFLSSYVCGGCSRELCLHCWETFSPRKCQKDTLHTRQSFYFVTKAAPGEVEWLLQELMTVPFIPDNSLDEIVFPGHPAALIFRHDQIELSTFRAIWARGGTPLVVSGLQEKLALPWDPAYMVRNWGTQTCLLHDCTDPAGQKVEESSVAGFFEGFLTSTYEGVPRSLKLKDWPPSSEFKTDFPELFQDFENVVPFPEYTRRTGLLNLASWLPKSWCYPDLGPKMYMAYPAPDFVYADYWDPANDANYEARIIGSTNLHLDITDAVNICVYAAPSSSQSPAVQRLPAGTAAIWHIFPPSASPVLRVFLKTNRPGHDNHMDPIHGQNYYITDSEIARLPEAARPYTIFQKVGDAVFIPAGCAHQVRNVLSAIKIAVDFLSPENIGIGRDFIEEHRLMSLARHKKEDVLQLWNCLYFAYRGLKALVADQWAQVDEEDLMPSMPSVRRQNKHSRISDVGPSGAKKPRLYIHDSLPGTEDPISIAGTPVAAAAPASSVTPMPSGGAPSITPLTGTPVAPIAPVAPVASLNNTPSALLNGVGPEHLTGAITARLMSCRHCKKARFCILLDCGCSICQECIQAFARSVASNQFFDIRCCGQTIPWPVIVPLLDRELREGVSKALEAVSSIILR